MHTIPTLPCVSWKEYALIDCGNFEKLERFGEYIVIRPEPQAIWDKVLPDEEWLKQAHVQFIQQSASGGSWKFLKKMPENWTLNFPINEKQELTFNLALTKFKHVGIFPEQSVNWKFIYEQVKSILQKEYECRVMNLFAYSGGASLAACAAGAETYHVDSIKQVVSWARRNMESSQLKDIRWVVEDAVKFVKRECKRGKKYHGIILDPPAYGHGANGEKWKLEDQINEMIYDTLSLLEKENQFYILNTYSLGFSALIIENLIVSNLKKLGIKPQNIEIGEIYIPSSTGQKLPLGVFCRF